MKKEYDEKQLLAALAIPTGKIEAVLDTDTYNEIDDQFAVAYALAANDRIDLKAIIAAPFFNNHSASPADGMERSYQEIIHELGLLQHPTEKFVWRGSTGYLRDRQTPQESEGVDRIIELAHDAARRGTRLYVIGIAAITNIASALLKAPDIANNIVIVWLGGHAVYCEDNKEFNLIQDVPAVQVVLDSGVPLMQIPCGGVAELLGMALAELKCDTAKLGALGAFLYSRTSDLLHEYGKPEGSKVIWDISAVAMLADPETILSEVIPTPRLNDDSSWGDATGRHLMRRACYMKRDALFQKMFERLGKKFGKA